MLTDAGARVTVASSAGEGHERLTHDCPDVLLCDIGMPNEDGLTFIARVRRNGDAGIASIRALAVTAYAREEDRERALAARFDSHLAKPFSAADPCQPCGSSLSSGQRICDD